jgi:hypothetical protein
VSLVRTRPTLDASDDEHEQHASFSSVRCQYVSKQPDDLRVRLLFDRTLQLLSSSQPPETASGATLVQCLAQIDVAELRQLICPPADEGAHASTTEPLFLLITHIETRLQREVEQAQTNLFVAAKNGPMYGCLSGINALLTIFDGNK